MLPGYALEAADGPSRPGAQVTLAATNGQAAISILDLRTGWRVDYQGATTAGGDALDLTITARGDLVVWNTGPPKLYANDVARLDSPQALDLGRAPLLLGTLEGPVFPADDGAHAWTWDAPHTVEYVDLFTGESIATFELPGRFQPQFTAGDDLLITDGISLGLLKTTGTVRPLQAGYPIEATAKLLAWQQCDSTCELVLTPLTDSGAEVRVPRPAGAERWTRAGAVAIPSSSPDLPTVTRDGNHLLVDAVSGQEPDTVHRLAIVDLETASLTVVNEYRGPGWASAFWDASGKHIIVATNTAAGQDITIFDASTLAVRSLPDALPDQFWVSGAG